MRIAARCASPKANRTRPSSSTAKLWRANPSCPNRRRDLARHTFRRARRRKASDLREGLALDPENASFHYQLGQAYGKAGQSQEAEKELATTQKLQAAAGVRKEEQRTVKAETNRLNIGMRAYQRSRANIN